MNFKNYRLQKLLGNHDYKLALVPLDHGVTNGPIQGIEQYINTIVDLFNGGADAVILHKGLFRKAVESNLIKSGKLIMHLSASTSLGSFQKNKILVSNVETAVKYGADGISIHINLGGDDEKDMLKDLGYIADECCKWGMPLLTMMYFSNPDNENNVTKKRHLVRVAEELGADIIKIKYLEGLDEVVSSTQVPLVISGGEKVDDIKEIIKIVSHARECGAKGFAIGRNIFQYDDKTKLTQVLCDLLKGNIDYKTAVELMGYEYGK